MSQDLLKIKTHLKKKKPVFRRVEKHRKKTLPDNWRKPKGHHSKIRRAKRWEMKMPKIGRRTPKTLTNKDRLGRKIIMINKVADLRLLNNKETIGVVSATLGLKKKAVIAKEAMGKTYVFINFKPEQVIKQVSEMLTKKKKVIIKEQKIVSTKPSKPIKAKKPTKAVNPKVGKPVKEVKKAEVKKEVTKKPVKKLKKEDKK